MITTDAFWSYDGTNLNDICWNVESLGGGRDVLPQMRGSDLRVSYRPGMQWMEKTADSRTIILAMWLTEADSAGTVLQSGIQKEEQFNANRRALRRLFFDSYGREKALVRRWREPGGVMKTATAYAQQVGDLSLAKSGPFAGAFTVSLLLTDPYFYGPAVTTNVPKDTPTVINQDGDVPVFAYGMSVQFNGALGNPKLTRTASGIWVKAGTSVAAADSVLLDQYAWTAIRASDSANIIGAVTHSGARPWMVLDPGNNTLTLTADSGTGTATVIHKPAYL